MSFEKKVAESFRKIRTDIDDITTRQLAISKSIKTFEKRMLGVEEKLKYLMDKFNEKPATIEKQVSKRNSSKRNDGQKNNFKTIKNKNMDPIVSYGTSPKKENKRSKKIKSQMLSLEFPCKVSDLYRIVVDEKELCSKTTFYRFIKQLILDGKVQMYLDETSRMIRKI